MIRKVIIFSVVLLLTGIPAVFNGLSGNDILKERETPTFEIGDILFMDVRPFWLKFFPYARVKGYSNDHCALYIGDVFGIKYFIESSNYTLFGIIDYLDGVQYTSMWWFKIFFTNFSIGKVDPASKTQKQTAVDFMKRQLCEPYQDGWYGLDSYDTWHSNPDLRDVGNPYYDKYYYLNENRTFCFLNDPYIDYWTCAELVWAGYLHAGIEIDGDPYYEKYPGLPGRWYYVGCTDIRKSENVSIYPYGSLA